jgi:hypothetical protein
MPLRTMLRRSAVLLTFGLAAGCSGGASSTTAETPAPGPSVALAVESVRERFAGYTLERARRDGYERDRLCLDALSFGQPGHLGAMGFHATNTALLRGPIAMDRPQAFMFDDQDRLLGVEYEIVTDAVREPPQLFGRVFAKLPAHPGVAHEHYALHLWFIPNPNGQFSDFNPSVSCPAGSAPEGDGRAPAVQGTPAPEHGAGH